MTTYTFRSGVERATIYCIATYRLAATISRLSETGSGLASVLRPRKITLDPPGLGGRNTTTCCFSVISVLVFDPLGLAAA
jgi:hypothetical protein